MSNNDHKRTASSSSLMQRRKSVHKRLHSADNPNGRHPRWGRVARTLSIEALTKLPPLDDSLNESLSVPKRKSSIPSTPSVQTGSPAYQQIQEEIKFLCKEVPHFDEICTDIPVKSDSEVEAQTTFVFQLLKWILEYGKPAVVNVDRAEREAESAQTELAEERDGVRKDFEKLTVMVRELTMENSELKEKLASVQEDLHFFESQMDEIQETEQQDDIVKIEYQETVQVVERQETEIDDLQRQLTSTRQQLSDVRKSADDMLAAYNGALKERDQAIRELKHVQTLAMNMERSYQAQMDELDASRERLEEDLFTAHQEKMAATLVQTPTGPPPKLKQQPSVAAVISAKHAELNTEPGMSMFEYSDGLQDGDLLTLQLEMDDCRSSSGAPSTTYDGLMSPFESMKHFESRVVEVDLEEVKLDTYGVDRAEFGSEKMSTGVDVVSPETEFECVKLMTGVDPLPPEEFESARLSFGVDLPPKEEFESGVLSFEEKMEQDTMTIGSLPPCSRVYDVQVVGSKLMDSERKNYNVYLIRVLIHSGPAWEIAKRYSEIRCFHQAMANFTDELPYLTSRRYFNMRTNLVKHREERFGTYFNEMLAVASTSLRVRLELESFLEINSLQHYDSKTDDRIIKYVKFLHGNGKTTKLTKGDFRSESTVSNTDM